MLSAAADAPSGGGPSGGGGGVAGERERRSFSASDAAAAAHDARDTGPETGRRKRVDVAPPAAAAAPPPLEPAGPSFPAGAEHEHAVPVATPTRRRHRHSFSGKDSPPHPVPAAERATSNSRDSREVASAGPAAGYVGRGEFAPGPNVSPAHTPATPQRHLTDQRHQAAGHSGTGVSTPPSPTYFTGRLGDHASGVGVGGNTGGSPSRSGGACSPALGPQSSSSGGGASMRGGEGGGGGGAGRHTSPTRATHVTTPAGPMGPAGVQPSLQPSPLPSSFDGGAQQQPPSLSATGSSHGAGGGSGGPAVGDLGAAPVLLKPSFRGSDSLLTIPEDSTGFVLVTRPSSVSCEHGPHCECWAWSASAGGCAAAVRSPSASYLATASNPYGGPGKEAAGGGGGGDDRGGRRSGGGAFLGSIWNTAVNTFRGVAGGHGRRASWSAVRGRGGEQHRASVSPPTAAVSPAHVRGASSPRERQQQQHLSPHSTVRKGVRVSGSPLRSPRSGRSSSDSRGTNNVVHTHRQGGDDGGKVAVVMRQANANAAVAAYRTDVPYQQGTGGSSYYQQQRQQQQQQHPTSHPHHHRSHSEPPRARAYGSYNNPGGGVLEGSGAELYRGRGYGGSGGVNQVELVESQRVKAAADRAEVVGKRAILLVTLGDKTAQEAMALALESPSADADGGARAAAAPAAVGRAEGGPAVFAASAAHARRRHDMLTEALALYVKALALLQGALPGVLVVCEGVMPAEAFAAWNPLGKEGQQQQQQQQQQGKRLGRPSPSSVKVVAERAALVTKAAWLKEIFSQVLQRAEHCRAQAACAATAAAAAPPTASPCSSSSSSSPCYPVPDGLNNPSSSEESGVDGHVFGGMVKTGGGGVVPCVGSSGNPAVAAVYRSATEHGQEAAVCYMLGRSDAAVTHYVRACALLQLLALEPEMAGAGAVDDGRWRHHAAAAAAAAAGEDRSQPQPQGR
ncbi:unnamed protein product, partial [Ectocarpus sp. 4 AP-2014]